MNIKLNDEQAAAYKRGEAVTITKPIKKWEPKGGIFYIQSSGWYMNTLSDKGHRDYGIERKTREQAEHDLPEIRAHNRMIAYRAEVAPMWKVAPDVQELFYVVYNHRKTWHVNQTTAPDLGTVCFPEQEAEILAAKLNNGEVVF